ENEGKEAGDPHGEEIREETEKAVRAQFLLDEINGTREVNVDQSDLMNYMTQLSTQYGIESNQLLQMLAQSGQLEQIFGEVQRSKALEVVLADVTVKNAAGDVLDLGLEAEGDDDAEKADAEEMPKAKAKKAPAKKAESDEETDAAEEKPKAKKAPAKKAPAKKAAAAEETDAAEEKPKAKKAPAKKTAAKKAESDEASESK
ncbi:MAG: trigger factor, partial [Brachybacterium sp.]